MKNVILPVFFLFITNIWLQAQTVPNGDFESWESGLSYDEPTGWDTPNGTISSFTTDFVVFDETTDVYSGSHSAKLECKDITVFFQTITAPGFLTLGDLIVNTITQEVTVNGGVPFTDRPEKLTGNYKFIPVGTDACGFEVVLLNYDTVNSIILDTIGRGEFSGNFATSGWESFEALIDYYSSATPNYMNINILSSKNSVDGSVLYVDDLEFYTPPAAVEYQYINIPLGWSFFSGYVDPYEDNIDSLCSPFINEVIIAKDGDGLTYWPQWGINDLGDIQIGKGYQIKLASAQTMVLAGIAVVPEDTTIIIDAGWSFLGYLRTSAAPIATMLNPIVSQLTIVKNGNGQTYWPQWGINTIGDMIPGEGYQIKMMSQQNLTYPANTSIFSKDTKLPRGTIHYKEAKNTGKNMTLGLPTADFNYGAEIAVYNEGGLLFGSAIVDGDFTAITIWGDDETTDKADGMLDNERFVIKLWDEKEYVLEVESWFEGNDLYESNKISVAGKIKVLSTDDSEICLYANMPNPFKNETVFSYYLPEKSHVEFSILNIMGEKVELLINEEMSSGMHKIKYQSNGLPAGSYFYSLKTDKFCNTKRMIIF